MIADIGAWPRLTLKDVDSNPIQTSAFPRLTLDCKNFPTQTIDEVKLNQQEIVPFKNEIQGKKASQEITNQVKTQKKEFI